MQTIRTSCATVRELRRTHTHPPGCHLCGVAPLALGDRIRPHVDDDELRRPQPLEEDRRGVAIHRANLHVAPARRHEPCDRAVAAATDERRVTHHELARQVGRLYADRAHVLAPDAIRPETRARRQRDLPPFHRQPFGGPVFWVGLKIGLVAAWQAPGQVDAHRLELVSHLRQLLF